METVPLPPSEPAEPQRVRIAVSAKPLQGCKLFWKSTDMPVSATCVLTWHSPAGRRPPKELFRADMKRDDPTTQSLQTPTSLLKTGQRLKNSEGLGRLTLSIQLSSEETPCTESPLQVSIFDFQFKLREDRVDSDQENPSLRNSVSNSISQRGLRPRRNTNSNVEETDNPRGSQTSSGSPQPQEGDDLRSEGRLEREGPSAAICGLKRSFNTSQGGPPMELDRDEEPTYPSDSECDNLEPLTKKLKVEKEKLQHMDSTIQKLERIKQQQELKIRHFFEEKIMQKSEQIEKLEEEIKVNEDLLSELLGECKQDTTQPVEPVEHD